MSPAFLCAQQRDPRGLFSDSEYDDRFVVELGFALFDVAHLAIEGSLLGIGIEAYERHVLADNFLDRDYLIFAALAEQLVAHMAIEYEDRARRRPELLRDFGGGFPSCLDRLILAPDHEAHLGSFHDLSAAGD